MKKIGLLLLGLLTMFSCEQEEMDDFVKSDVGQVQTRTASSIADFDIISELDGIPVNILNVGNTSYKYLSARESEIRVVLHTQDDGSLRQRWNLSGGNIILIGGNTSFPIPSNTPIIRPDQNKTEPSLVGGIGSYLPASFMFIPVGNYYKLKHFEFAFPPPPELYLQANSSTGSELKYGATNSTNLSLWEVCPVGEYELVGLEYVMTSVDNFTPTEVICDRDTYENPSSAIATWHYSVSASYTETSSFSETQGVSVSISNGLSVGIPSTEGSPSITVNTSMQQQTSKSWTFGTTDNKSVTKTRTVDVQVMPHTTVKLEAVIFMYEGAVTYVATLKKIGDTKTFRVKGKWYGACFSEFKARTYDAVTNKLLKTHDID